MTKASWRVIAAAVALGALVGGVGGCGASVELGDPLDPSLRSKPADVGLPVMTFLWKKALDDRTSDAHPQEWSAAAVDREALYVGAQGGMFYALRAGDGKILWKRAIGSVSSRPLLYRERIYIGTDDGLLMALDQKDGKVLWKYATKGAVLQPPALVGDGLIVFSNNADHVYALDRETGAWKWQYERDTPDEFTSRGHAGVAAVGDRVYTGFADGHVVALAAATGDVVWVRSIAGDKKQLLDVDSTPIVDDGVVYAASSAGGLYALDAADGTERWHYDVIGAGPIAIDSGRIYFAAAEIGLHALDHKGHLLWRQGLASAGDPARPVVLGDYLLLGTSEGGLFAVDKVHGRLLQRFNPGNGVSSEPTIAAGKMYLVSNGGILYAMGLRQFAL